MVGVGIYVKNSPRAIELYQAAFGLDLGFSVLNDDGTYFHAELSRNGQPFCALSEAREDTYAARHPIELGVDFDSREELEHAFALLSDEGKVIMDVGQLPWSPCAAIVMDPFGVRWFLSLPQHRPAEGWSPDGKAFA